MEHSTDIKLAIIMRLCGLSFRQDSYLLPWAFYDLAELLKLNPYRFTDDYFVCDVPQFIQDNFYFEVIDDVALRATCDVTKTSGSRIFIRDLIKLNKSNIRLHTLIDWRSYYSEIAKAILMCETIYADYFMIGLTSHELIVMKQITNSQLQRFFTNERI